MLWKPLPIVPAVLVGGICLMGFPGILRAQSPDSAGGGASAPRSRQARLLEAAAGFRELAVSDHRAALERYAAPTATDKLARLDTVMWPASPPRLGWSFFMSTAIGSVGALRSAAPVVAFYHPWSDVYLLTEWELDDAAQADEARLVAAEVLMGDWLRHDGTPPFSPVPAWVRSPLFKPAALAMTAAESVMAFEAAVPVAATGAWRSRLPRAGDSKPLEEYNHAGVPLLLAASLHNLSICHSPGDGEDPRLGSARRLVADLTGGAARGELQPLLQGRGTLPEAAQALRHIPREVFASLQPVSVILGPDDLLVFLTSPRQADLVLSLVLESKKGPGLALARVDVVSYGQTYRQLLAANE